MSLDLTEGDDAPETVRDILRMHISLSSEGLTRLTERVLAAAERERPSLSFTRPIEPGATWLIRKNGHFYRPNSKGYTASIYEAGLYSREDAEREAHIEPGITAHPISEYRQLAEVDLQNAKRIIALIDAAPLVAEQREKP